MSSAKKEVGKKGILFPAGVGEMFGVHGAHSAHTDQANGGLLVNGVVWRDVDGDVGHG